jgi:hypothetical protein
MKGEGWRGRWRVVGRVCWHKTCIQAGVCKEAVVKGRRGQHSEQGRVLVQLVRPLSPLHEWSKGSYNPPAAAEQLRKLSTGHPAVRGGLHLGGSCWVGIGSTCTCWHVPGSVC